ncbi:MAG: tRNA uridine-5-carboxymethylaminomethyl(34) synthesis GTPase MnmE [Endomicrobium sp.]|jgi:tRNA modification GTPase|nr:tRNA uridine-5-carboxymethylaminomethyl(34) synthesis GTPase MnmE [Endomicrobium sp.]
MLYSSNDTIAALSTGLGRSAIAIIRLSGKNTYKIINKIFRSNSNQTKQIKYGYIIEGNNKKDEVLCSFFKAPNTYTGDDLVEISVHGNPIIINMILNLIYKNGARPASPGEFTYRAFMNGKIDLTKAEAVSELISSKSEMSVKIAMNNITGAFNTRINKINNLLTDFLASIEANLEYPDYEDTNLSHIDFINFDYCINNIQKILQYFEINKFIQQGVKIVIIGKPNAGKSSLFNALLNKNRAIITNIPGTTTDVIKEIIDYKGIPFIIYDTAGFNICSKNIIEILGQKKMKESLKKADILIWVFDSTSNLVKNDMLITEFISDLKIPIIVVLNKIDLEQKENFSPILKQYIYNLKNLSIKNIISISAKTKLGINVLLKEIYQVLKISDSLKNVEFMINSRHFYLLNVTLKHLVSAKQNLTKNLYEIACFEINRAQFILNEILGINIPKDILDVIFSKFCVGK